MRAILLAISAFLLGAALQVRDGLYSPYAIALLAGAVAAVIGAMVFDQPLHEKWIDRALLACVLGQLALLFTDFPGSHHESHLRRDYAFFMFVIAIAIVIVLIGFFVNHIAFYGLIGIYLIAGTWLLRQTPTPFMDVFVFQEKATSALNHRQNPYTIALPDIYRGQGPTVYATGTQQDGKLAFGFPYLPLVLEWNYLWESVAPDYRYGNLFAIAVAGLVISDLARLRAGFLAAALLLFTPRGFFIIEQGWTEPLTIMLLTLSVWCAMRAPSVLPIALGLLLASKQYCLFILPLTLLSLPVRKKSKFLATAAIAASLVTLPFVLIDFTAFWNSAVVLQFRQPFREDALSFAAALARIGFGQLSGGFAIAAASVACVLCARYCKRSADGFALSIVLVFLVFFAINKQAFANYYMLVIAAMCCAIATSLMPDRADVR